MADKPFLSTLQHIKQACFSLITLILKVKTQLVYNPLTFKCFHLIYSSTNQWRLLVLDDVCCRVRVVVLSLCRFFCYITVTKSSDKKSVELLRNVLYLTFKVNNLAKHFCLCSSCVKLSTPLHIPICIV